MLFDMSAEMGISTSLLLQPSPYVISPSPYLHLISTCTSTSPSFPPHLPHHLYNSHFHPHLHLISTSLPPASSFLWLSAVSGTVGSFQWLLSGHCKGCEQIAQEEPTVPLFRAERRHLAFWAPSVSTAGIQPLRDLAGQCSPCAKISVKLYSWVALSFLAGLVTVQKSGFGGMN